jgi:hypothetical protein
MLRGKLILCKANVAKKPNVRLPSNHVHLPKSRPIRPELRINEAGIIFPRQHAQKLHGKPQKPGKGVKAVAAPQGPPQVLPQPPYRVKAFKH